MKVRSILFALTIALFAPSILRAQLPMTTDPLKGQQILITHDTLNIDGDGNPARLGVLANCTFTSSTAADWLHVEQDKYGLLLRGDYHFLPTDRQGFMKLTSEDGTCVRKFVINQKANSAAATLEGDHKIVVKTATASQYENGEPLSNTIDGKTTTLWHSPWSSSSTKFPITLTYKFSEPEHLDYMVYTPRQDGNNNGNFRDITVAYTTSSGTTTTLGNFSFEGSGSSSQVDFVETGVDDVTTVTITVKSGQNNYASCAEMAFYRKDGTLQSLINEYFADQLCTKLRPGITADDAAKIQHPFVKQLVHYMLSGQYDTKYRVGTYEPYDDINRLRERLKTSNPYCAYENPTGIYFEKGQTVAVFVEGITTVAPSLKIYCFGEGDDFQTSSSYPLKNGLNIITAQSRGNSYISYYSEQWKTLPNVRVHFAMGTVNGYFDLQRGDTNTDWQNLLANAVSDIIDIRSQRLQVAMPLETLKKSCPKKGVELATIYDNVVYREREVMGLVQGLPGFTEEPKNRQFARPAASGMFASTEGAYAAFGSLGEWCNPDNFGYWGIAHELGHNNQINNGFKWSGCGETTNNIYASWVEHKVGKGYHRLEDEVTGIDDYRGTRGGRFETYLEEGVRKGVCWQLQDGPDYHGAAADGQNGSRNYDHFVKVVPLYQLNLWTQDCEKSPNAYGKVIQGYRNLAGTSTNLSCGQQQLNFMRNFCDSTKINFLPFFEKAGMLRPINAYIEDYARGWLTITEKQIADLKAEIEAKNYAPIPEALNYINAYNLKNFKDEVRLDTSVKVGTGCTRNGTKVTVTHSKWPGVVGFETYNADGEMTAISMYGLGDAQQKSTKTVCLFPSGSKYIMAVGYDGTRVKCFEVK